MIKASDLGWMAAVLDLQGLPVRKDNKMRHEPKSQLVLVVNSRNFGVIRRLSQLTGTSPERKAPRKYPSFLQRGCVEHCPTAHIHVEGGIKMPPTGVWSVTGIAAAVVLHSVLPYMRSEDTGELRDMMAEAMNKVTLTGQGSGAVRACLRRLLALGWKLPPQLRNRIITEAPGLLPELATMKETA